MTITPKQAMKLNAQDRTKIRELEKKIDSELSEEFTGPRESVCVSVDSLDQRTFGEIKRMYCEAGWNVKYESEQRDECDYLIFTAKRTREGGSR